MQPSRFQPAGGWPRPFQRLARRAWLPSFILLVMGLSMRQAEISRNTLETRITVRLNLDGTGQCRLATGVPFLDHARPGGASRPDRPRGRGRRRPAHRRASHGGDIGITIGQALAKAVGDKKGLRRYRHAYVPLDEALSRVCDRSLGRPGLVFGVEFTRATIGAFDVDLIANSSRAWSITRR